MVTVHFRTLAAIAMGATLAITAVFTFRAWDAGAAGPPGQSVFVPIEPCRLFDYRPAPDTVGTRTSPLGPNETHTQQVTGSVGNCTVPAGASAVAMNVTAVAPTAQSNLRLFPANQTTPPLVSNLNYSAGQTPVPNKVDVKLSPSGAIKLLNLRGSVFVLGDVVGYYASSPLTDLETKVAALEADKAAQDAKIAALETTVAALDPIFATVAADGTLTNGSHVVGVSALPPGEYDVTFDRDVSDCAYVATIGEPFAEPAGLVDTANFGGDATVTVFTQDPDGAPPALADRAFHLVVVC